MIVWQFFMNSCQRFLKKNLIFFALEELEVKLGKPLKIEFQTRVKTEITIVQFALERKEERHPSFLILTRVVVKLLPGDSTSIAKIATFSSFFFSQTIPKGHFSFFVSIEFIKNLSFESNLVLTTQMLKNEMNLTVI